MTKHGAVPNLRASDSARKHEGSGAACECPVKATALEGAPAGCGTPADREAILRSLIVAARSIAGRLHRPGPRPPLAEIEPQTGRPEIGAQTGPVSPVLNLHEGARYVGLSYWSFRGLVSAGVVPVVRFPAARSRHAPALRRVLVARADLDALIARYTEHN